MKINTIGPVIGCFASSLLMVPNSFADGYFGSVSAGAVRSDNGNKSTDNKIAEVQEQYTLNLGASYENYIGKFEADYGASYSGFSEETQPNKSTLEGHSSLHLGRPSQIAELLIEHSRQTLLNKPDSLDLTNNQDEREVLSISPTLNGHFSSADVMFLQADFSDIRYLETELNNSTRLGGTLGVLHRITEVDSVGLNVQSTEVEFEYFPASNYTLRTAMLSYTARLRQLSYSLQVGANQSETEDGEKYTDPSYLASLSFKSGVNTFALNIKQELTDTSFGDGNKNMTPGSPSSDGGINQANQITRKKIDAEWSTTALCNRCTLTLNAFNTDDQYLIINKSANEVGVNIDAAYVASPAATISFSLAQVDHDFEDQTLGESYKATSFAIEYAYEFGRNVTFKASFLDEKREGDDPLASYREKSVGISVGYSF